MHILKCQVVPNRAKNRIYGSVTSAEMSNMWLFMLSYDVAETTPINALIRPYLPCDGVLVFHSSLEPPSLCNL